MSSGLHHPPPKVCPACGRQITWRKKWVKTWESVKYCSAACRRSPGTSADDAALEAAILKLLEGRARSASICPSEAARQVFPEGWAAKMEATRRAARRLVAAGKIQITQQGRVVDPSTARGAIRLRKI